MKIEILEAGLIFKNYADMCEKLGLEIKNGMSSRNAQFKELSRYCKHQKFGHKIHIIEIYEKPLPKIDGRGKSESSRRSRRLKTPLRTTNPKLASQWSNEDNGMEIPDTVTRRTDERFWWICPECNRKIFATPMKRFKYNLGCSDAHITCPYCNLSKDAKVIYDYLMFNGISFELEYIFHDLLGIGKKHLRFDFAIFEKGKLIILIEYDGEFHDEELNPDPEKHKTISTHDSMKNEYCLKNDIPLLRIHHSDSDNIGGILFNILLDLSLSHEIKTKINTFHKDNILQSVINLENQKMELQKQLLSINNKIAKYQEMLV